GRDGGGLGLPADAARAPVPRPRRGRPALVRRRVHPGGAHAARGRPGRRVHRRRGLHGHRPGAVPADAHPRMERPGHRGAAAETPAVPPVWPLGRVSRPGTDARHALTAGTAGPSARGYRVSASLDPVAVSAAPAPDACPEPASAGAACAFAASAWAVALT